MLFVPALPIGSPTGEINQISRAEFWLILMASFESIWGQWNAGYPPAVIDRLYVVSCAAVWLVLAAILGWPIVRCDGLQGRVGGGSVLGLSIASGSALASLCVALNGTTFGPQSRVGLVVWFLTVGCLAYLIAGRFVKNESTELPLNPVPVNEPDPALEYSWARRWMGLTGIGIAWVLGLTVAGACLPSYDADVREHRNMAARQYYLQNRIASSDQQREINWHQGSMMPALFWMNPLVGVPPDPLSPAAIRSMMNAVRIGQSVQALLWCVAIGLLIASLARAYGIFASVLATFAIAAHPGLFELVRLGGGAGEGGLYLVSAISLLLLCRGGDISRDVPLGSLTCIAAGAAGHGWILWLLVTLPILVRLSSPSAIRQLRRNDLFGTRGLLVCCSLFVFLGLITVFWGGAFIWALCDAGLAWGRGGEREQAFLVHQLPFFFAAPQGAGEGVGNACLRIVMNSTVHSLHLIPLAAMGLFIARNRTARELGIGFILVCAIWWILTPQQDRDWVIAVPLLAWPMASGIDWMRERGSSALLAAISGAALVWSVLVLAAWPMSDNRLLVPIEELAPITVTDHLAGHPAEKGRGGEKADLAVSVNSVWNGLRGEDRKRRWLLVGSADTFRWLPKVDAYGMDDVDPWESLIMEIESRNKPIASIQEGLLECGIDYLVLDWEGIRFRDRFLAMNREAMYRNRIHELQQAGLLRRIDWSIESSRSDCFEISRESVER